MSNRTPVYNFLYLEDGDIIYSGYDSDNMNAAENQFFGTYSFFGQGVISGWEIYWMGCTSNPYVMLQREALLNAYRDDPYSFLGLQYQLINYPVTESDWKQCVVVSPGVGIVDVFHAATEQPQFFRFTTSNHFYIWAQKNVCTNTEYICEITAPEYPDEDYDLYNFAVYLGELYTNTVDGNISITQITYSQRRRELKQADGEIQRILSQALINHVHSGEGDMPDKINLNSQIVIVVPIVDGSNTFLFEFPSGFNKNNYNSIPQVYLNGIMLEPAQYQISGNVLFLTNSVSSSSSLQIIYKLQPGKNIYITSDYRNSPIGSNGDNVLSFNPIFGVYYLTDGTTSIQDDGSIYLNVFKWDASEYSDIKVYLNNEIIDDKTYVLNNSQGTFKFTGAIVPSLLNFTENQIYINFVTPSIQITGQLSINRIKSISANAFKSGTVPKNRLSGLDHLGFFRIDSPAISVPYKKLIDSGDHIHFYPHIDSPIQHSDYIISSSISKNIRIEDNESLTPPRSIISTANGLFATKTNPLDFKNIVKIPWNTDIGLANVFSDNYFGNFNAVKPEGVTKQQLDAANPKIFYVLSLSKNQFKNVLYLSSDFGSSYQKVTIPSNSSNQIVSINDFISTIDIIVVPVGNVVTRNDIQVYQIYYLACSDGLYSTRLTKSQNKARPIWDSASKFTTNFSTGSINKISEAVNIEITTTKVNDTGSTETTYNSNRRLYAATDNGLFIYDNDSGFKFTTAASDYNLDNSSFNYVCWIGFNDSDNSAQNVVWADSSRCYYTQSAAKKTTQSSSNYGTTTSVTFNQALTAQGDSYSVSVASTANIDLTSAVTQIDGYNLSNNDKVLIKNQSNYLENGIYIWSSSNQLLTLVSTDSPLKVLVQNGELQSDTEWIEIENEQIPGRIFALWYAKIIDIDSGDQVNCVVRDLSNGPNSNTEGQVYANSFFVSTGTSIYRVLITKDSPQTFPDVTNIVWDVDKYGSITKIDHYNSNQDTENGILVVYTSNGIYKSSSLVFSKDSLSYSRFINAVDQNTAPQSSVYDDFSYKEYTGKITSVSLASQSTNASSGTYINTPVYTNSTSGNGLTVDVVISSGFISEIEINNPGFGYSDDVQQGFIVVSGTKIIIQNIVTEGIFEADYESQAFVFSKSDGLSPSSLLYESSYTEFYTEPWSNFPIVSVKINNIITKKRFNYNAEIGLITFFETLNKNQKDNVLVSLSNRGQYIYNAGTTPHNEVFQVSASESNYVAKLSSSFDPATSIDNILPLDRFDSNRWNTSVTSVKITGTREAVNGSNIFSPYTEIVQVSVDMNLRKVFVKSKPTTLPLTSGSLVYIARTFDKILGIEDKITQARSALTYHMDSVSHNNVYNLSNAILDKIPNLYDFNTQFEVGLTGVNQGLKNTISVKNISQFDPEATFFGYSFGVDPSESDVAASPSSFDLILDFEYGNDPLFATNKGIWQYQRISGNWFKIDSLENSNIVYFANKILTNSLNVENTYAGTDQGLFSLNDNVYSLNPLFEESVLSIEMGDWYFDASNTNYKSQKFEAYGKQSGLSFILRKTTSSGVVTFQSDFFDNHIIYDIYYNTFNRYDAEGNKTSHPSIYLATDKGLWAFTTDALSGSPSDRGPNHYLLVGREMFGNNIIRNINKINPEFPGVIAKIYKIFLLTPPAYGSNIEWIAVCTSNGVYLIINWKSCDVGDPKGLNFYSQNNSISYNKTIGTHCYTIVKKTNDSSNSIYFVGTNLGVFKTTDRCFSWSKTAQFNGQSLSVNDLEYITNGADNYLLAVTNSGIWVSENDGDNWMSIEDVSDSNINITTAPASGISLSQTPEQSFQSISSGTISKAFIYLDTSNLNGISTLYAKIRSGSISTNSEPITFDSNSFSGMYGFAFTNTPIMSNTVYYLGVSTANIGLGTQAVWVLSNLSDPYSSGVARTSGSQITDKDFFFRIDLNTPASPTEIIEPVGFYNTTSPIGFSSGTSSGVSISSNGYLYSNVGIICNFVIDTSKSFEINDLSVVTTAGVSTSYTRQAVVNALVPTGISTDNLYTLLSNGLGTSKMLISMYGFNASINDLLFYSTSSNSSADSCFSTSSDIVEGYTNSPTIIQNAIAYVSNFGRISRLFDAVLYNSRLQYPEAVVKYYKSNFSKLDTDFINVQVIKDYYKKDFYQFLNLNLEIQSGVNYNIYYGDNVNNFIWPTGSYAYGLIVYSNGTSELVSPDLYNNGVYINNSVLTPSVLMLSYDWEFDTSISDLSSDYSSWTASVQAKDIAIKQYALSFKPLLIVLSDGNDNSKATPLNVKESIAVAWDGFGSNSLLIEPSKSGNQGDLQAMVEDTNYKFLRYSNYPESEIKSILIENDDLNLFSSYWEKKYDFEDQKFISYIYTSFETPGESLAVVSVRWSSDRINFSNYIVLNSQSKYYLNQKVLSIQYKISFTESYVDGIRSLPFVTSLYHVTIVPSIQTYITYPQPISGQIFEVLSNANFSNNNFSEISSIVGRTQSSDLSYFEYVQTARNACLPNRQTSYKITEAYTTSNLNLLPSSVGVDGQYNYLQFYVVNEFGDIQVWSTKDTFNLFIQAGTPVSPSAYTIIPESGIIAFQTYQGADLPTGQKQYESYTATIDYAEEKSTIIGEPTYTYDNKTYYFKNGRIPTDAQIVVLINQNIYKGSYTVSSFDGSITFSSSLDASDQVTVFVKFSNYFRCGLQINSYNSGNLMLQNFNFTYTSLDNLPTYLESFAYTKPALSAAPVLSPVSPAINDLLFINYKYNDVTPENGTIINWWRKRTGIDYVTFNSAVSLSVINETGITTLGISTFTVSSLYNTSTPFILLVTVNNTGVTTTISQVVIDNRGENFIGTGTNLVGIVTQNGITILNFGSAMTAFVNAPSYVYGYATTDYFVRISPLSPIGYTSSNFGFSTTPTFNSMPNYDQRMFSRSVDQGERGLFDANDLVFCTVAPCNGYTTGSTYKSNIITIINGYTPSVSNLDILNSRRSYSGVSTSLTVSASNDQIGIYSYFSGINNSNYQNQQSSNLQDNIICWYKSISTGPIVISSIGILSSSLIDANDQIYYSLQPGKANSNGTIGYGATVFSDVFLVVE